MKTKFFGQFRILYPIGKQVYKLELLRNWIVHNVFHVSLLEQEITRKRRVDEEVRQIEFDAGNNSGKYKMEAIWNSAVYARESESGHLPGLYYLVS